MGGLQTHPVPRVDKFRGGATTTTTTTRLSAVDDDGR
jgi:hypothetical protein